MQLRVVARVGADPSTPPSQLVLPAIPPLPSVTRTRQVSLNERNSETVLVSQSDGNIVLDCANGEPFGPRHALLGIVAGGEGVALHWDDPITENPGVGDTEIWEMYNFTADAHPIHIHEVTFDVVDREGIGTGEVRGPEVWETGRKDTVVAYPGEITRVRANYDRAGLFVWHCHIVEHEDHEMMRPYVVGPMA
jgi:FtsP/CotA-like multicopper oxidase with cupredoxin domain